MRHTQTPNKVLFTTKEVAEILGLSELTIKRHVYEGSLPSFKVGRARRIPRAALEQRLRELGAGPDFCLQA